MSKKRYRPEEVVSKLREADILIRIKFYYPINHLSDWKMLQSVTQRIKDYIRV